MQRLYIIPKEGSDPGGLGQDTHFGPKYFSWRNDPDPPSLVDPSINWSAMDYGFAPYYLILAHDISVADDALLSAEIDVYTFPEVLDQVIAPGDDLDTYFESIGIPTDWLTPANTYLEFLRQTAAMFQFNQRYSVISNGGDLLVDAGGLDARYSTWDQQTQDYFNATLESLGYPAIVGNPRLRQLMKQAGDAWGNTPFIMGDVVF